MVPLNQAVGFATVIVIISSTTMEWRRDDSKSQRIFEGLDETIQNYARYSRQSSRTRALISQNSGLEIEPKSIISPRAPREPRALTICYRFSGESTARAPYIL